MKTPKIKISFKDFVEISLYFGLIVAIVLTTGSVFYALWDVSTRNGSQQAQENFTGHSSR